jgi:hypothetical protein
MTFLKNKTITTSKMRYAPRLAYTLSLIKTRPFSTSKLSSSEYINYLHYIAEKMCSAPAAKVNNINNIARLTDTYEQEWSMFYLMPDITQIQERLDNTIYELSRGEHILDHYYSILEYAKPLEYGNLQDITHPIIFSSDGLIYDAQYLDIERMFKGYDFYFSGLYGQIYHLLQHKNLLPEKSYSELAVIVKDLDKDYYIFKHIFDHFKQSRNEYLELLDEKKEIDNIYTEYSNILDIFFPMGDGRDLNYSIITECINMAYLSELPFFLDADLQQRLLSACNDNVLGFSELPYSNLQDLSVNNDFIINQSLYPVNITYDHDIYLEAEEFHDYMVTFNELPYSNMGETQISPEEENLAASHELPFSNPYDDLGLTVEEENLSAFQELPFSNQDDDLGLSLEEENLSAFQELPFSNTEDNITTVIDTVLEVLNHIS